MPERTKQKITSLLTRLPSLVLRPVPVAAYKPVLQFALDAVLKDYPHLFERMEDYSDKLILMNPTDLPFVIVLSPDPLMPLLTAYKSERDCLYDASITGSLSTFMQMLDGKLDGDALFFSRDLTIEGDTECVVALRNALDDSAPDVFGALAHALGPFAPLFDGARKIVRKMHERIAA